MEEKLIPSLVATTGLFFIDLENKDQIELLFS